MGNKNFRNPLMQQFDTCFMSRIVPGKDRRELLYPRNMSELFTLHNSVPCTDQFGLDSSLPWVRMWRKNRSAVERYVVSVHGRLTVKQVEDTFSWAWMRMMEDASESYPDALFSALEIVTSETWREDHMTGYRAWIAENPSGLELQEYELLYVQGFLKKSKEMETGQDGYLHTDCMNALCIGCKLAQLAKVHPPTEILKHNLQTYLDRVQRTLAKYRESTVARLITWWREFDAAIEAEIAVGRLARSPGGIVDGPAYHQERLAELEPTIDKIVAGTNMPKALLQQLVVDKDLDKEELEQAFAEFQSLQASIGSAIESLQAGEEDGEEEKVAAPDFGSFLLGDGKPTIH